MAAVALPELIVPGELYVPNGLEGPLSIQAAAMPNGDDCARITEGTGTEDFMAFQPSIAAGTASRAPHLLQENACALSFWIRRNQNFDSSSSAISAGNVSATGLQATHRFIMGVMDPLAVVSPTPSTRTVSWAFITYSTAQIQLVMDGFYANSSYYWMTSNPVLLPTGEWTLVVVNREAADFSSNAATSPKGAFRTSVNGNVIDGTPNGSWKLYPAPVNDQRFCLGDGTTLGRTAGGAAGGAAWDISKLCFHDQEITAGQQLELIESMRYGPAS